MSDFDQINFDNSVNNHPDVWWIMKANTIFRNKVCYLGIFGSLSGEKNSM